MRELKYQTKSKEEHRAILELAYTAGVKYHGETPSAEGAASRYPYEAYPVLNFAFDEKYVSGSAFGTGNTSLADLLRAIAEIVPNKKTTVRISADYNAVAREDFGGVDVGCTFVSIETVREILSMLENKGEVK